MTADPLGSPTSGSRGRRFLATLAGTLALGFLALFTLGGALAAPLGMVLAGVIARRRHRPLTRGAGWIGAVLAASVGMAVYTGVAFVRTPPAVRARFQHTVDSISAVQRNAPPPAWIERLAPGAAKAKSSMLTSQMAGSRAFTVWMSVLGEAVLAVWFGTIVGTLGWIAGLLLAYAHSGRWLPTARGARALLDAT
ncbi:MAG TPA: hypothetical protein VHE78_07270 [Gemmatimonadaceae bacterium]|nr:hypothetical protein [Gemmatimonadaceae bacterium]